MNLTDEQKAILKETGSMIVVANAGTGKTTTLIEKIKRDLSLIKGNQRIVCITFSFDSFIGHLGYKLTETAGLAKMKKYAQNLRGVASKAAFYRAVIMAAYLNIETDGFIHIHQLNGTFLALECRDSNTLPPAV